MASQSKVHKDKICKKLDDKETRKNILEGRLEKPDCDNEEFFKFFQILKRKNTTVNDFNPLYKEGWSKVVKKSKKRSTPSFFQKETMQCAKYR